VEVCEGGAEVVDDERDGAPHLRRAQERGRRGRRGLVGARALGGALGRGGGGGRRGRDEGEVTYLLPLAVEQHLELLGAEVCDEPPVAVCHHGVELHEVGGDADDVILHVLRGRRRGRGRRRRLRRRLRRWLLLRLRSRRSGGGARGQGV
jgi:hypothetical protein